MHAERIEMLTPENHDRRAAGLTYVYPVVSRRAGGVSVGVNLNPNNQCNWRCIYCQVPNLKRGVSPRIDLTVLQHELDSFLRDVVEGPYLRENVPEEFRRLRDLAISGNGEPTSSTQFDQVVEVIARGMQTQQLIGKIPIRVITNGSFVDRESVRDGLRRLSGIGGEVWLKIDRVTEKLVRQVNDVSLDVSRLRHHVETSCVLCPTWIQTCVFAIDGEAPHAAEQDAFVQFFKEMLRDRVPIRGLYLYTIARPSMQPEAEHLAPLPKFWLDDLAKRVAALGLYVQVNI